MNWKRAGLTLALALLVSGSYRPVQAYCWEVGLKVNNCGSIPIKIYNVATGAQVFSGTSRTSCSNGANFYIDLNNNCPVSSDQVRLQVGTTYLFEFNYGSDFKKAWFLGAGCPPSGTCDSIFVVTASFAEWLSGAEVHELWGYPNAKMLSATLDVTSTQQVGGSMQYDLRATASPNVGTFSFAWLNASPLSGAGVNPNNARSTVTGSPLTATVNVTSYATSEPETVSKSITLAPPSSRNGMTWVKLSHTAAWGVDNVGCPDCNPYTGDTSCATSLPILCIKTDGAPNPGIAVNGYNGWIGGNIALTQPVRGDQIGSLANANALCASAHGTGYQMAEFHHSLGGWNWSSRGNVADGSRFWLYINNQPANCWN